MMPLPFGSSPSLSHPQSTTHALHVDNRTSIFGRGGSQATTSINHPQSGGSTSSIFHQSAAVHSLGRPAGIEDDAADDRRYAHIRQLIKERKAQEREEVHRREKEHDAYVVAHTKEKSNVQGASTKKTAYDDLAGWSKKTSDRTTGKFSMSYQVRQLRRRNPTLLKNLSPEQVKQLEDVTYEAQKHLATGQKLTRQQKLHIVRDLREKGFSKEDIRDTRKILRMS